MMPAHTGNNTDPANWGNPPVPESWWPIIRAEGPAYNPMTTPTRGMGQVAELIRNWPGAIRSQHPTVSFSALGSQAETLLADHPLEPDLGEGSPLSRLYDLDGSVLLLGVDHDNNTSLHLAEYRADWPGKAYVTSGAAMLVDGERQWVSFKTLDLDTDDFVALGHDFEAAKAIPVAKVGEAETRLFRQRPLVDFGVQRFEAHR
jgi:aminoglycoside 3-N-acetyltransferase